MIEVEKKVALKESNLKTIEQLGTFLGSRTITDTYYDTPDFCYTTSDIWLRAREGRFELKVGMSGPKGNTDYYEEITDEELILQKLGLEKERELGTTLEKVEILPYATLQTIRRKYQIEEFAIDVDLAYCDDFIYRVAEIELMVSSEDKIPEAKGSIEAFACKLGIDHLQPIKAKLIEYLCQKNPTHYRALIHSGVVL